MQPGDGYKVYNSGKGLTLDIEKPWPSDWLPTAGSSLVIELYRPHPFRIVKVTSATALAGGFFYNLVPDAGDTFAVLPGTVNSIPCSLGLTSCGAGLTNVYVQTYPNSSVQIIATTSTLSDSDTEAYVLIGQVDQYDKKQFVHNNLLCERFVLGQQTASYHHSSDELP